MFFINNNKLGPSWLITGDHSNHKFSICKSIYLTFLLNILFLLYITQNIQVNHYTKSWENAIYRLNTFIVPYAINIVYRHSSTNKEHYRKTKTNNSNLKCTRLCMVGVRFSTKGKIQINLKLS